MRSVMFAVLFGTSALGSAAAMAQNPSPPAPSSQAEAGPADLCKELLAYAEKKKNEPPKDQAQAPGGAGAPTQRAEPQGSGTQGGGSVDQSSSNNTSNQSDAAPLTPVAPGAAPEPASSAHATDSSGRQGSGATSSREAFELAGGITVSQVQETARAGDRQACRDMTQTIRLAGGDLPAALIALAAYEPDPAKRK